MRSEGVELISEAVEFSLLSTVIGGGRSRGFGFEGSVHTLVTAILLRFAGFDEFGVDTESDPPSGQTRESSEGIGGKRYAVIGTDAVRQAELFE